MAILFQLSCFIATVMAVWYHWASLGSLVSLNVVYLSNNELAMAVLCHCLWCLSPFHWIFIEFAFSFLCMIELYFAILYNSSISMLPFLTASFALLCFWLRLLACIIPWLHTTVSDLDCTDDAQSFRPCHNLKLACKEEKSCAGNGQIHVSYSCYWWWSCYDFRWGSCNAIHQKEGNARGDGRSWHREGRGEGEEEEAPQGW